MALLAERFQLQTHQETRATPAIVLRAPGALRALKPAGSDEKYSIRMESGDVGSKRREPRVFDRAARAVDE